MRRWCELAAVALPLLVAPAQSHGADGKWTPQLVHARGASWLRAQGIELPLERLWDPRSGTGLLANVVQLPTCSGSFVSPDGLLLTNHHCAVGALQEHSSPARNLLRDGFVAGAREDELRVKGHRALVPRAFRDVTRDVIAAIPGGADDRTRHRAVERAQKRLVAECERRPGIRCQVAMFDGGGSFSLTEFDEITDVRLVWAPPAAIGAFGGEVDNWSWPRHSGDFALLRAYAGGKAYRPAQWFPVSARGVRPGDAVAVLGYPKESFRALLASEVQERTERWFPAYRDLTREWAAILQEGADRDPAVGIAVANDLRVLLNRRKNAEGQLASFARGRVLERRRADEERVLSWAARDRRADALEARAGLEAVARERLATWDRDFLLDQLDAGPRLLRWPALLARRAVEAERPDDEREPGWQERDLARLKEELLRDQKQYAPSVDRRVALSWIRRALALPAAQRIAPVDARFAGLDEGAILAKLDGMLAASKVMESGPRLEAFGEPLAVLAARADPLVELGLELDVARRELRDRRERWAGALLSLRPAWTHAEAAAAGHPLAPDANRSLRVSFGRVRGYVPRDGVTYGAQTTLAGVVEKHTGEPPFDAPAWLLAAARGAGRSRFADPVLKDVPVAFLADLDTTTGNSGSPVVDARGRLVGVNFDRVWENAGSDLRFVPEVARNISADVRYLLWVLELQAAEHRGATTILGELGVGDGRPPS